MRTIARILGWIMGSVVVASVASALAVAATKRRVVMDDPEADEIHLVAAFEPIKFTARSAAFRGGTVEAWYGGGIVDLREAVIDPAGARLTVRTMFGGFEVAVPETWRVVTSVRGIGGAGDSRRHIERPEDAPTLTIDGTALFGGIGITSVVTEEEDRSMGDAIERSRRGRQQVADLLARTRAARAPVGDVDARIVLEPAPPAGSAASPGAEMATPHAEATQPAA